MNKERFRVIHFKNGEFLIGTKVDASNVGVTMIDPIKLVSVTLETSTQLLFMDWNPFTTERVFTFSNEDIFSVDIPNEDTSAGYVKSLNKKWAAEVLKNANIEIPKSKADPEPYDDSEDKIIH
jgi:hypothetical protein